MSDVYKDCTFADTPKNEHTREFFLQMRECRAAYRKLGECIALVLPGTWSAIDLGAGTAHAAARLVELGWKVTASDLFCPEDLADLPLQRFDLTEPLQLASRFHVAICTETAEHIHETYADVIVENVADSAIDYVVWSAAQPGQEWPGHVNLQEPEYWLRKFRERGFEACEGETQALRNFMRAREAQHHYARENFYVLRSA